LRINGGFAAGRDKLVHFYLTFPFIMKVLRSISLFISILLIGLGGRTQSLGGSSVFNFLRLPNAPQLSALGGINLTNQSNDIGLAWHNPAQLTRQMHSQMNAVFNSYYAGIKNIHWSLGYHHPKLNTNFALGVHYFSYGSIAQTDASGNIEGNFRPRDYVVQLSASRRYLQRWQYGLSLKYIASNYGLYRSSGVAADVGVLYRDTTHLFQASVLAKNMGAQLKQYSGSRAEDLPFDLQLGISKRLANAPLQFSFTAHHLHQFDTRYNDTTFNSQPLFGEENGSKDKKFTFDKIFRHIIIGTQVYIGDKIEVTAAYNHLRRKELNIDNTPNGLNGFSLGIGALLGKLQIRYARAYYQNNTAYNQFGINMQLNQYFGLGKWGEKIGW
jgi:hypothetical protein